MKFWVNVKDAKHPSRNDNVCTAVYGTLDDAKNYAYDHMVMHYSGFSNIVTIYDENWNVVEIEEY